MKPCGDRPDESQKAPALRPGARRRKLLGKRVPQIDKLYEWLAANPSPDCDRILRVALGFAEPAYAERIAEVLARRGTDASRVVLLGHYGALPAQVRSSLCADPDRLREWIAAAFRSGDSSARQNSLLALQENLSAQMSYLLPEALHDPSHDVRALAAQVLRAMAERVLASDHGPGQRPDAPRPAATGATPRFVATLREILCGIESAHRVEVLEVLLWFASELGEQLWERLNLPRSRLATLAFDHVETWDDPRMAGFLLGALRHAAWRPQAASILTRWSGIPRATALLKHSIVLDDPEVRHQIALLRNPRWFSNLNRALTDFTADLRAHVPRWIAAMSYPEAQKQKLLTGWLKSPDPQVRRAALYELSHLPGLPPLAPFNIVAAEDRALRTFARWYVLGRQTELVQQAIQASRQARIQVAQAAEQSPPMEGADAPERPASAHAPPPAPRPRGTPAGARPAPPQRTPDDFERIWEIARVAPAAQRSDLVAFFRDLADMWGDRVGDQFASHDARDRLLAMQIVSTRMLAHRFASKLEALRRDPEPTIARLAERVLSALPPAPAVASASTPWSADLLDAQPEEARREARAILAAMVRSPQDEISPANLRRLTDLLRCAAPLDARTALAAGGKP